MKKIVVILLLVFNSFFTFGQWDSLGNGIKGSTINGFSVNALFNYNNNLYIGGLFDTAGNMPANSLAVWNGTNWNIFSKLNIYGSVSSFTVYNGNLIAGGIFDSIGGIAANNIALWNGTSWSKLGSGLMSNVEAMIVYNGNLYAAGWDFFVSGSQCIAMWNGSTWLPVGTGVNSKVNKAIFALAVYKGNLYAGGVFDSAGGIPASNIAMWDGTDWSAVGSGFNDSTIGALTVYNNELYAGGFLGSYTHSIGVIEKWDGSTWSAVGSGFTGNIYNSSKVFALTVFDSAVCVAGSFDSIGGIAAKSIAYWNGSTWETFGNGIFGDVYTADVFNSELYAGGVFEFTGNENANNVAVWSGPLGIPDIIKSKDIIVSPNPSSGKFTFSIARTQNFVSNDIEVYNVLGEQVFSQLTINNSQFSIDLSNKPNGVYFYRVISEREVIGSGKITIER